MKYMKSCLQLEDQIGTFRASQVLWSIADAVNFCIAVLSSVPSIPEKSTNLLNYPTYSGNVEFC